MSELLKILFFLLKAFFVYWYKLIRFLILWLKDWIIFLINKYKENSFQKLVLKSVLKWFYQEFDVNSDWIQENDKKRRKNKVFEFFKLWFNEMNKFFIEILNKNDNKEKLKKIFKDF